MSLKVNPVSSRVSDHTPQTDESHVDELLDWSASHGNRFTHDLFKFPGKFHPPVVESLIRRFQPRLVVDPMCGVGTVAVEAMAAGVPSVSLDVDPVSAFFASVKTTPIAERELRQYWTVLRNRITEVQRPPSSVERLRQTDLSISTLRRHLSQLNASHLIHLDYWFRRYVLIDYLRLRALIYECAGLAPRQRRFFVACLISSVRRISRADPYTVSGLEITRVMREREERGYTVDVYAEFSRRVEVNIARMSEFSDFLKERQVRSTRARVIHGDSLRAWAPPKGVKCEADLVLFSPPYCNAIEYSRRHQLEYFLGGFLVREDIPAHNKKYVGRRAVGGFCRDPLPPHNLNIDTLLRQLHTAGSRLKAWQLWHYFNDMSRLLNGFRERVATGGHVVIIVGDSTTEGIRIPTGEALAEIGVAAGYRLDATATYQIKNRTMQYPLKQGKPKINEESIIVLRRA